MAIQSVYFVFYYSKVGRILVEYKTTESKIRTLTKYLKLAENEQVDRSERARVEVHLLVFGQFGLSANRDFG